MDVFKLTLEARNPERNCFRFWEMRVGPDLLDDWVVTTQWGRLGTEGQVKILVVNGAEEAQKEIRKQLQRRTSSPKRIGIGYEVSFLFDPGGWLNGAEIIGKLKKESCVKK